MGESVETETQSRLTPPTGLSHDAGQPTDSSNEDFLFHLYRGSELLQDNRVHEAKEELERALQLQPRDSNGQDLLAVVYFRLGHYPRAIQIYEQLRRRNANDTSLLLNLSLCYLKTGQPQLARRDLEQLLEINPGHSRAWGYLGLACERLGDLAHAERAFTQGGHAPMARRIAARRENSAPPPEDPRPTQEIRDVADAAYQELDTGELSFALAAPTSDRSLSDKAAGSWLPHEIGQREPNVHGVTHGASAGPPPVQHEGPAESPPSPPQPSPPPPTESLNRRPTLIAPVGAPPAYELLRDYAVIQQIRSQKPPSFTLDVGAASSPSVRRPVVAVPSPFGPSRNPTSTNPEMRRLTLPAPLDFAATAFTPESLPPTHEASASSAKRPTIAPDTPRGMGPEGGPARETTPPPPDAFSPAPPPREPQRGESLCFPERGVVIHSSGVALVRATSDGGFATRVEAIRSQQSGLTMQLLERHVKGKSTGESFGGIASPMAIVGGEGQLVLAARPGRTLAAFRVDGEMCFAREDVLLGFDASLAFENGRLTTGDGEHVLVVQLRGSGAVLFETMGEVLALDVRADRSLSVRRDVVLGWFGRLVPRAVSPADAPCGQRGLVGFAGDGRVLIMST